MSKENSQQDWDQLWVKYNKSLKTWREVFESLQKATNDVQSKYAEVLAKALEDSTGKTMSQFIENWQKSMIDAGMRTFKQLGDDADSSVTVTQKVMTKTLGQTINDLMIMGKKFKANTGILEDASKLLNDPNQKNEKIVCGKLGMFANQVNQSHHLTPLQRSQLIEATNAIKTLIGCKVK